MARAHRIGQKQEVRVLRLVTASPIEEKILATANEKLETEVRFVFACSFISSMCTWWLVRSFGYFYHSDDGLPSC